ncbi:MAG: type II secretion system protein M [Sandaracinaceae bacterium]|nr:type II secretion system protein M [Sandaracinaceae bacterium]MBP7681069.1 type II secretion system protein M [Deltaproteobacteria bacterium]MBK6810563.1 type II secretion system protein M [Sandaracinaceae bacterium]MBK7154626.1 type II secretion system protein M [Sandaracinaceae bacterium]MBK7775479.1 type II secretion system protein M [Sandaracinaceae bacterium]
MALRDALKPARDAYDNLTERERRLVALLGVVFVMIVVLLPILFMSAEVSDMETENEELRAVMREIEQARPRLTRIAAENEATRERYANRAPALGGYVEQRAAAHGLSLREINDQPELALGNYMRRGVRVRMPDVAIDPVLEMLEEIDRSEHPVAVSRLQIDRYRDAGNFNVEVGVSAYDRQAPSAQGGNDAPAAGAP